MFEQYLLYFIVQTYYMQIQKASNSFKI